MSSTSSYKEKVKRIYDDHFLQLATWEKTFIEGVLTYEANYNDSQKSVIDMLFNKVTK